MTPEAQRIAIAEACGWKWYRIPHSEKDSRGPLKSLFLPAVHEIDQDQIWLQPGQPGDRMANLTYMERDGHVPDYLNDLNAMHEAEKALLGKVGWVHYSQVLLAGNIHASAAQRAEAFLRTIGKWDDA